MRVPDYNQIWKPAASCYGTDLTACTVWSVLCCILGMFFGILSVLKNKACRIISSIFVDVIRGVPMIVLAYFIYFGVPYCLNNMIGFNFTLTALQAVLSASPLTVVLYGRNHPCRYPVC